MDKVHSFKDGDCFGDVALSTKKCTRTARIVTTQDSHFAIMAKADYQHGLKKCLEKVATEEQEFLRMIPFFSHITKTQTKNLWNSKYIQKMTPIRGKELIEEGRINPFVFIIKQGEFTVKKLVTKKESDVGINGVRKFLCG